MSVRLHIALQKLLEQKQKVQKGGNSGYDYIQLGNTKVNVSDCRAFVDLHGDLTTMELPSDISVEVIEQITINENFLASIAKRRTGEYHHCGAKASVELKFGGKNDMYFMSLVGPALAFSDMKVLYRLIREGRIWPHVDYEAEMVPPPYRHLRDLVDEAWGLIRRDVRNRLYRIQSRIQGRIGL